jgi:hypothetical protein
VTKVARCGENLTFECEMAHFDLGGERERERRVKDINEDEGYREMALG